MRLPLLGNNYLKEFLKRVDLTLLKRRIDKIYNRQTFMSSMQTGSTLTVKLSGTTTRPVKNTFEPLY